MYAVKKDLYNNDDVVSVEEEVTEEPDISGTETTEETTEQETVADEMTEEKAVELCQKAYDALSAAEDMAEIARTCDMELYYYYFETDELVDDIEELTAYTGEFLETKADNFAVNFITDSGVAVEDIK